MARTQTDLHRLVVSLEARLDQYNKQMSKFVGDSDRQLGRVERRFATAEKEIAAFGKNFFAGLSPGSLLSGVAAGSIAAFARDAVHDLAEIDDQAKRSGLSIKDFQKLTFASLKSGGAGATDIVSIFETFNRLIGKAATQGGELADILKANGVPLRDQNGVMRSNVDLFLNVVDLIKNAKNETDRANLSTLAMGRSIQEMLPFLLEGSDSIRKWGKEAETVGFVLDEKVIKRAHEFDVAWNSAWANFAQRGKAAVVESGIDLENLWRFLTGEKTTKGNVFFGLPSDVEFENTFQKLQRLVQERKKVAQDVAVALPGTPGTEILEAELKVRDAEIARLRGTLNQRSRSPGPKSGTVVPVHETPEDKAARLAREQASKRAADEKKKLAEATDVLFAATRREIDGLVLEAESAGKSVYEIQRLKKEKELLQKLEDEHRQHGGGIVTAQEAADARALADAYGRVSQSIEDNARELGKIKEVGDTVFGDLESALDNFVDTGKLSFKSLVASIIKDLAKLAIHNTLGMLENGVPGTGFNGIIGAIANALSLNKVPAVPVLTGGLPGEISRNPFDVKNTTGFIEPLVTGRALPLGSAAGGAGGASSGFPADVRFHGGGGVAPGGDSLQFGDILGGAGSDILRGGAGGLPSNDVIGAYISQAAAARGIDPATALKVWAGEGKNAWQSNVVKNGVRETSFGPFQLRRGGGLGDAFQKETGLDVSDPANWRQQVDFSMNEAAKGGWGPWYGARAQGITGRMGIGPDARTLPLGDLQEAQKAAAQFSSSVKQVADTTQEAAKQFAPTFTSGLQQVISAVGQAAGGAGGGSWGGAGGFPILSSLFGSFGSIGGAFEHSIPFGGSRAGGGPVNPGLVYKVHKDEMIVPRVPGMVVPKNNGGDSGGFMVHVEPSPYFDVRVSRISHAGDVSTLDNARRNLPDTEARFRKLGTTSR